MKIIKLYLLGAACGFGIGAATAYYYVTIHVVDPEVEFRRQTSEDMGRRYFRYQPQKDTGNTGWTLQGPVAAQKKK